MKELPTKKTQRDLEREILKEEDDEVCGVGDPKVSRRVESTRVNSSVTD